MSLSSFPSSQKIPTRSHYLKIKQYLPTPIPLGAVIYHRGGITRKRDNTDVELDFRQESDFLYLSGVEAAGYHIVIVLASDRICLIRPTITPSEQLWKGIPDSDSVLLEKYDVDIIVTEDELHAMFMHHDQVIYSLSTTDISALPRRCQNRIDTVHLPAAINEARLIKFPWELDMMRYAAHISSHAHMALMIECAKRHRNQHMNEAELEALFRWVCSKNGLARQCYIPIVASGPRAAVLHYTDNNKSIPDNALVLVDAGGEYRCYGSDVTRTFPVTGQFTQEQKTIYNIVLKAQNVK
jgi:Xaa-Pro dipeptidase